MKDRPPKLTAGKIARLLRDKHWQYDHICVKECGVGCRNGEPGRRLDFLAMKRSHTSPTLFGYEIKINRQDFTNDAKWEDYLEYCNCFYFVCPDDLIDPDELPSEVGLIYVTYVEKWGKFRLEKVRDAVHRPIEPPVGLFVSILINRFKGD